MEIRPFRGWRYNTIPRGDVSALVAPPYDVLSASDKDELLVRSARNIVAVDLPHVPPKQAGPEETYAAAADRLTEWKSDGVLRRDASESLYAYEQTYEWAGRTFIRPALIAGVRATALGEDVIPHEQTHGGPQADRLRLTERTRMQLSPIFGFYSGAGEAVSEALAKATAGEPDAHGVLRGVTEKLWVIDGADAVASIREALRDAPAFIADGHHRYQTAIRYRDALREAGAIDDDHQANFVMFALVDGDDPGLLVLPTHRAFSGLTDDFDLAELAAAAGEFEWTPFDGAPCKLEDAEVILEAHGPGAMALIGPGARQAYIARLRDAEAMRRAAPDESDAWRALDTAVLDRLIVNRSLQPWCAGGVSVEYTPSPGEVLQACRDGRAQLGVLLEATHLQAVRDVALAGGFMPSKSTYFYPKLATGMVLKPLE